jgi:carboxypeptidase D
MPHQSQIATLWRTNLHKILNFLHLVDTGIKGYVHDNNGQPLRDAILTIRGNTMVYKVTKNLAHFQVILPAGKMQIEFSCSNYTSTIKPVDLKVNTVFDLSAVILQEAPGNRRVLAPVLMGNAQEMSADLRESSHMRGVNIVSNGADTVSGFVLDTSNQPLSKAKVMVKNTNVSVLVDGMGAFHLTGVPNVDFELHASAPGYAAEDR